MHDERVFLAVDGLTIAGRLYRPEGESPCPVVCFCHGIPAWLPAVVDDGGYSRLAERLCRQGLAVFIFNFRGAGESGGNLDIIGWTRDLSAAIDYLSSQPEVDGAQLTLLGFSAGAAVSVYVAARDERVVAVATCACPAEFIFPGEINEPRVLIDHFRSVGTIRDDSFPPDATAWFNNFRRVDPIDYVAGISPRPLLLVHGDLDDVVGIDSARRLYEEAEDPKQIAVIEGAGHRLRANERALAVIFEWLKSHRRV